MMTPKQLEWRRKQVLERLYYPVSPRCYLNAHKRGYQYGDIRCIQCKKWIRPSDPEEAKEIKVMARGKRFHDPKYCPTNSIEPSAFSTTPKFHKHRKYWLDTIKRY